jgi:hypothetical protein
MTWTARKITEHLVNFGGPFEYRRQFVAVPNVAQFFYWEADLLVCSKAGFLTEVEVKISAADWKNDRLKDKWKPNVYGERKSGWSKLKNFYYAAPLELAERWKEFGIPGFAGVYGIHRTEPRGRYEGQVYCRLVRPAEVIPDHRKVTDEERLELARLASMRAWTQGSRAHFAEDFYRLAQEMLAEDVCSLNTKERLEGIVKVYEAQRPTKIKRT